ncbi:hypothetical protein HK097_001026 [Rhizophlyctis rosea]|uniref:Uncharacterized protein n=1 Tax=Rhizophlyctis rosea TaxID=64517 RepID=A0AAD5X6E0_9FUNG|nr:hypothetical protein HK097_001026 [Rhizophlyctis rosea]
MELPKLLAVQEGETRSMKAAVDLQETELSKVKEELRAEREERKEDRERSSDKIQQLNDEIVRLEDEIDRLDDQLTRLAHQGTAQTSSKPLTPVAGKASNPLLSKINTASGQANKSLTRMDLLNHGIRPGQCSGVQRTPANKLSLTSTNVNVPKVSTGSKSRKVKVNVCCEGHG